MVVRHGIEVHRGVGVGGDATGWCDGHRGNVGRVEQNLRSVRLDGGVARVERSVCISGVGRCDDDPCLRVRDGHPEGADIKPEPAGGIDVVHRGGNGIAVINTGLHTGSAPRRTTRGAVPSGRCLGPRGGQQRVNAERNRGCTLSGSPRIHVQTERCRVHVLIDWERNLRCIKTDGNAAFICIQGSAVRSSGDGSVTDKVGVGVLRVQGRVLDVGVTKGRNFVSGLHGVGKGVIVVVHVIGVTYSEVPARRGRARNRLVYTLNPPREHLTGREVVCKAEGGVGDLRIFPGFVLENARVVGDGDNVPGGPRDWRPCQRWLGRRREQAAGFIVEHLTVAWRGQDRLTGWNDAVDVVDIIEHDVRVENRIGEIR